MRSESHILGTGSGFSGRAPVIGGAFRRVTGISVATLLATVALTAATASAGPGAVSLAAAASTGTCSYAAAGTGTYARSLCWFDLSNYNAALAGRPAGSP